MPEIRARDLHSDESEEHILRRLGKAVVAQWDHLPQPVRDQLVAQAVLVQDRDQSPDLHHQIMAVILKHQGYPS